MGKKSVVAIAQSVNFMIQAKPKSIKPEGENIGWKDSIKRAELKSMLINKDDSWEYLNMSVEDLQKF